MRRRGLLAVLGVLPAWPARAQAPGVSLTGQMGGRALLTIDGQPVTLAPGASHRGVRLESLGDGQAVVSIEGRRQTLQLGGAPVRVGGGGGGGATRIVLTAGSGGHFTTAGAINGGAVQFMVDTGATTVSMSTDDADRIGLKYQQGARVMLQTANGSIPAWRVTLDRVRVGEVEVFQVEGVVARRAMPWVLLGNSFLSRFQMKRENDVLTLERRF